MLQFRSLNIINAILLIMVSALLFISCDDTICSNLYTANVNISFFDRQSRDTKTLIVDSVGALATDSMFYREDTASLFILPLNSISDSTVFLFFTSAGTDTLTVSYQRTIDLQSKDCGFTQIFEQLEVPYSSYPEVIVKSSTLSITNDDDIEIYY